MHAPSLSATRTFLGQWSRRKVLATRADRQPAVAIHARRHQDPEWRARSLHVIEPANGGIASLTVYAGPLAAGLFAAFGLPPMVQGSWSEPEA